MKKSEKQYKKTKHVHSPEGELMVKPCKNCGQELAVRVCEQCGLRYCELCNVDQ